MQKLLPILIILFSTNVFAECETFYRPRNTIATIHFELRTLNDQDEVIGATQATASECQIIKDSGSAANITNSFAHNGLGTYRIQLTSAELDAKVSTIRCKNNDNYRTKCLRIETYGASDSEHPYLFHRTFPASPTTDSFADFIKKGVNKTLSCIAEKE
jgi:hypothetical protein